MAAGARAQRSSLRLLDAKPEMEFSRGRIPSRMFADVFSRRWHGEPATEFAEFAAAF